MTYQDIQTQIQQLSMTGAGSDELAQLYRSWLHIKKQTSSALWPAIEDGLKALRPETHPSPLVHISVTGWEDNRIQALALLCHSNSELQMRDAFIPADEFDEFVGDCQGWEDMQGDISISDLFTAGNPVVVSMLDETWEQWLEAYETPSIDDETMSDIWNLLQAV